MPTSPPTQAPVLGLKPIDHPAWAWMSQALSDRRTVMRWPKKGDQGGSLLGYGDGLLADLGAHGPGRLGLVSWVCLSEQPMTAQDLLARLKACVEGLTDGGLLMAADLGPGSLARLAGGLDAQSPEGVQLATWRTQRLDLHDLGDGLSAAGLAEPVMESETLALTYRSEQTALTDLQALGLLAGPTTEAWSKAVQGLRGQDGLIRLELEVVLGHAWRMPARKPKQDPHEPVPIRFAPRT